MIVCVISDLLVLGHPPREGERGGGHPVTDRHMDIATNRKEKKLSLQRRRFIYLVNALIDTLKMLYPTLQRKFLYWSISFSAHFTYCTLWDPGSWNFNKNYNFVPWIGEQPYFQMLFQHFYNITSYIRVGPWPWRHPIRTLFASNRIDKNRHIYHGLSRHYGVAMGLCHVGPSRPNNTHNHAM